MNQDKSQRPSPIVMLAPLALVLMGYHYLFHSKVQKSLSTRQNQQRTLEGRAGQLSSQTATVLTKTKAAKAQLAAVAAELESTEQNHASLLARREQIRAGLAGAEPIGRRGDTQPRQPEPSPAPTLVPASLVRLVSGVIGESQTTVAAEPDLAASSGQADTMRRLCALLAEYRLQRVELTPDKSRGRAGGTTFKQREELAELLDGRLPEMSQFRLTLHGSFLDLHQALHAIDRELPSVIPIAISLEAAEPDSPTRVWTIQLGMGQLGMGG